MFHLTHRLSSEGTSSVHLSQRERFMCRMKINALQMFVHDCMFYHQSEWNHRCV